MRLLIFSLCGCASTSQLAQSVSRNATWAPDQSAVLLVENHYQTTNPSAPYFSDPDATDWEIVFVQTDETLSAREEKLRLPDPSPQGGGGLFHPVYWLPNAEVVLTQLHDEPVLIHLADGSTHSLTLPTGLSAQWFGPEVTTSQGLVASYAPSPNGASIAVMFTLAYLDDQDPGFQMLRYLHGLAFFDLEGEYQGGTTLTPWNTTHQTLKIDPPAMRLPFDLPLPPAISPWRSLQFPTHFLWASDSTGVVIVDRGTEAGEHNLAISVSLADPHHLSHVNTVPRVPVVTTGGPARADGLLLMAKEPEDDPNSAHVDVVQVEGWTSFEDRGTIGIEDLPYGY